MRPRILALFLCLSGLAMAMPAASQPLPEDLLLVGGRIRTMDPARPWAEAVLIGQGRIVRVGSDAEVAAAAPKGATGVRVRGERGPGPGPGRANGPDPSADEEEVFREGLGSGRHRHGEAGQT